MSLYFSYDPNQFGMEFHKEESDARDRANEALGFERDDSSCGWSETVTEICWGEVNEIVVEKSRKKVPEGHYLEGLFDEIVDYDLEAASKINRKMNRAIVNQRGYYRI